MQISDILKKCIEIPGVSLKRNDNYMELHLTQPDGKGLMTFYSLFPGIILAYIHVNSPTWPAPDLQSFNPNDTSPLLINYCVTGRCELLLNNDSFVYLKDGELSLTKQCAQKQYVYPRRIYEGIEFFLDLETIQEQAPYIEEAFEISPIELVEKYCPNEQTYLSPCEADIAEHLHTIWRLYDAEVSSSLFQMKIETLALLGLLLNKNRVPASKTCVFFTATQVDIAKRVEKIITADLRQHHPAWEMAEQFSISETSLKNYFRGVYGQNISSYLKEMRMNRAAHLLVEGKLSVSEVSESVGYLNQSKFAAAFKRYFNVSPLEYRRLKHLEKNSKDIS